MKKKKNEKKVEKLDDDVFVQFKSYNIKENKSDLIKTKINNYKYGGNFEDLKGKIEKEVKCLSYSDYKKNI